MQFDRRGIVTIVALSAALSGCTSFKVWSYQGGDRTSWQKPTAVIASLQLDKGDAVADIGAGGGYFAFRLADEVGPTGKVYAVEVDDAMVAHLKEQVAAQGRKNVEVVRGRYDDPLLPLGAIDLAFTSNTYHHIDAPSEYFRGLRKYLKPGGRVAILDYNDQTWFPYLSGHYSSAEEIEGEMAAAGYLREIKLDFIDRQSFQIFVVRQGARE
jgi:ubiquinone/menaquinone biosynthesis C-methylase UbiE